jgi:hypothetical protein
MQRTRDVQGRFGTDHATLAGGHVTRTTSRSPLRRCDEGARPESGVDVAGVHTSLDAMTIRDTGFDAAGLLGVGMATIARA